MYIHGKGPQQGRRMQQAKSDSARATLRKTLTWTERFGPGATKDTVAAYGGFRAPTKPADEAKLVFDILKGLGTPRALTVWLLYSSPSPEDKRQLVELSIDPHNYPTSYQKGILVAKAEEFRRDYLATKLLSKHEGLDAGIDRTAVAIKSAEEAEALCREQNIFLRQMRAGHVSDIRGLAPHIFHVAKAKIARVLGDVPEFFRDVGWSSGRTTSAFGNRVSAIGKYNASPDVTVGARQAALQLLRDCPGWGASVLNAEGPVSVLPSALNTVQGNVMLTVPKNAKTERVICYEPHMNIRLQRVVGEYIRSRLSRKARVNLVDQSINQKRARQGSITGGLATLDLSMASDLLCYELVTELLPIDWACLLDRLRSWYTTWPSGAVRRNEKFSSMGNGFTFELESLIFWAVASSMTPGVTVYGDDIVVPTRAFEDVSYALEVCGFKVNKTKSYASSPFRESCGGHYFGGVDVTPFFIRSHIRMTGDVVLLHNNLRHWGSLNGGEVWFSKGIDSLLTKWRDIFPAFVGPSGYGDGHYHVNLDVALSHKSCRPWRPDGWVEGWWFKTAQRSLDSLVGKRVEYGNSMAWAALCASLGPKAPRSLWKAHANRKKEKTKTIRVLATAKWPDCQVAPF